MTVPDERADDGTTQPVRDAMSASVHFVPTGTTVRRALELARQWGVHHLPVGEADATRGLVCTCDLRQAQLEADIATVVAAPAVTVTPDTPCEQAAGLMKDRVIGSLLVSEGQRVVGIVTRADLLRKQPDGQLAEVFCVCCGAIEHLMLGDHEQLLCVECHERATQPQRYEGGQGA